jgi:hypothetical protein
MRKERNQINVSGKKEAEKCQRMKKYNVSGSIRVQKKIESAKEAVVGQRKMDDFQRIDGEGNQTQANKLNQTQNTSQTH